MRIVIRRGRNIAVPGKPTDFVQDARIVGAVGLVGGDYPNLRPVFRAEVGSEVASGQALFVDSRQPEIRFCAPVSGRVTHVVRGQNRSLDHIVIAPEGEQAETFAVPRPTDAESVRRLLLESGQWPAFRTRPFERIPDPSEKPAAIFVTAMDTEPLAADPAGILREETGSFRSGVDAVRSLTDGPVFVCHAPGALVSGDSAQVKHVEFAGPHPAGLPGTHMHFLMPVGRARRVWHIGYQDVIAIGRLFETGRVWSERIISLAGPGVREPGLIRTYLGADLSGLVAERCAGGAVRVISGSPLSGARARFLGRYHTQACVFPLDWHWKERSALARVMEALGGHNAGAIIPIGAHESVMPLNILVVPLLRALSAGDYETAERLGCLELAESDMALLSHVCPSRTDYAQLLRHALDELENWA